MIRSMADNPIVFALANPVPEISYEDAMDSRPDVLMSTGRSDYPNRINNVIGFPYIFRGALDVHARAINEEMKMAAVHAIADLAKQPVPDVVNDVYHVNDLTFGPKYFIPKPVDPRLITEVSAAVAKAAMESGVARTPITDWGEVQAGFAPVAWSGNQTDPQTPRYSAPSPTACSIRRRWQPNYAEGCSPGKARGYLPANPVG